MGFLQSQIVWAGAALPPEGSVAQVGHAGLSMLAHPLQGFSRQCRHL